MAIAREKSLAFGCRRSARENLRVQIPAGSKWPGWDTRSKKIFRENLMSIRVENRIGKRSKSQAFGSNVASSAGTEKLSLDYQRGTETILIVDDEEPLRAVIADLLTQLGYHMLSAANGDEALVVATNYKGRIDLLLSDVVMEGLPGPELAEKLLVSRPELKVIFMSGFADSYLAPNGILEPGTVLVQKPFTIRMLSSRMREVLDHPSAG